MAQVNWYSGVIECYRHKHVTLSRLSIYWALDACSSLCQAYYMLFRMSCVIAVIICFIDEETVKLYFCQTKWQNQDSDSGLAEFSWKFLTKISEHWLKLSDLAGIYTHPTCFAKCSCKVFYSKRVHCSMPQTLKQFLSRPLIFTLKPLTITGWLFCRLSLSVGLCPYDSTGVLYLWQKDHRSDMFSGRHGYQWVDGLTRDSSVSFSGGI